MQRPSLFCISQLFCQFKIGKQIKADLKKLTVFACKWFLYKLLNKKIFLIIFRFKLAIDKVMPAVLEKYMKDCQRLAAEK